MHVHRVSLALTRIETATARIRDAARAGRSSGGAGAAGGAGTDEEIRYQALRRETATALAELDHLIARLEA